MNAESNLSDRILAEQERLFFAPRSLGVIRKPLTEQYPQRNRAECRHAAKMARRERAKVA